jgi:hypothetical protein
MILYSRSETKRLNHHSRKSTKNDKESKMTVPRGLKETEIMEGEAQKGFKDTQIAQYLEQNAW